MNGDPLETSLTVRKALRLLREFSEDSPAMGISEAARRLEIPRSTAARLVATLESEGYLRKTATGGYTLGLSCVDFQEAAVEKYFIRSLAYAEMWTVREALQLSTYLSIFDHNRRGVLQISRLRAGAIERLATLATDRVPLHATSGGKVHLAFAGADDLERLLRGNLKRYTSATMWNLAQLRDELRGVRESSYAIDQDEFILGISSIAVPIFSAAETVEAALSVAGHSDQFTPKLRVRSIELLQRAAHRISERLGERAEGAPVDLPKGQSVR